MRRVLQSSWSQKCAFYSTSQKLNSAKMIDGRKIAKELKAELKLEVESMLANGKRRPQLTAIIVGHDPASQTYIKNKMIAAEYTGIDSKTLNFPDSVSQSELLNEIERLNNDSNVDGLIVQLPLPKHLQERTICNSVIPSKDVDGFHTTNVGRFCVDLKSLLPATPAGVMELLKRNGIETFGKNAVVCGRSKNVGMPLAMLLHADGTGETQAGDATVTICHRYTPPEQLRAFVKMADILVVATGIPNLITGDMVKKGVVVVDVGINRIKDPKTGKYKLVGDVNFDEVKEKASWITPVPGGVGPMTVAMLMKNTVLAAKKEIEYSEGQEERYVDSVMVGDFVNEVEYEEHMGDEYWVQHLHLKI